MSWSIRRFFLGVFVMTALLGTIGCGTAGGAPTAAPSPSPKVRQLFDPTHFGYSNAARYGDLVWTAGHLPFDDAYGPIEAQVEAVLDDLEASLNAAGAGFDTVLKTNVYLVSMDDWDAFNQVYVARVGQYGLPPRTSVQIAGLGLGRIEIEMVAHVRAP